MAVLQQMIIFALLMLAGCYARRKGMVTKENQAQLSAVVVRIAYPSIILSGALEQADIGGRELWQTLAAVFLLLVFTMAGAWLLPRLLGYDKKHYSIVNLMTVFSNIGFMGVPMIDALYGRGALLYMIIFLIPFNLLFFSYAMRTIKGRSEPFSWRAFFNEGMIACFLAVLIYMGNISLPYALGAAIGLLGSMTAPLAMLLIGSFLDEIEWRSLFADKRDLGFVVLKMIVLPVAAAMFLRLFIDNNILLAVCLAAVATPSGHVLALLAAIYNEEAHPVAVRAIMLTTLAAPLTMPLVYVLTGLA
jgi:hypothetical protein